MEPTLSSETSAFILRTPGKFPKEHRLHSEHGESLKNYHTHILFMGRSMDGIFLLGIGQIWVLRNIPVCRRIHWSPCAIQVSLVLLIRRVTFGTMDYVGWFSMSLSLSTQMCLQLFHESHIPYYFNSYFSACWIEDIYEHATLLNKPRAKFERLFWENSFIIVKVISATPHCAPRFGLGHLNRLIYSSFCEI